MKPIKRNDMPLIIGIADATDPQATSPTLFMSVRDYLVRRLALHPDIQLIREQDPPGGCLFRAQLVLVVADTVQELEHFWDTHGGKEKTIFVCPHTASVAPHQIPMVVADSAHASLEDQIIDAFRDLWAVWHKNDPIETTFVWLQKCLRSKMPPPGGVHGGG